MFFVEALFGFFAVLAPLLLVCVAGAMMCPTVVEKLFQRQHQQYSIWQLLMFDLKVFRRYFFTLLFPPEGEWFINVDTDELKVELAVSPEPEHQGENHD